jgi:hypothetical protein
MALGGMDAQIDFSHARRSASNGIPQTSNQFGIPVPGSGPAILECYPENK